MSSIHDYESIVVQCKDLYELNEEINNLQAELVTLISNTKSVTAILKIRKTIEL